MLIKLKKLNPRCIEAYCASSSIYIALEDHESALEDLQEALLLTSPVDFRRNAIEEIITGCKLALKIEHQLDKKKMIL